MGTDPTFIAVPFSKKDHRCVWNLSGTERVRVERAKYLHVKLDPNRFTFYSSRSIFFFACVNGPYQQTSMHML